MNAAPATAKQVSFARSLQAARVIPADRADAVEATIAAAIRADMSRLIAFLLSLPKITLLAAAPAEAEAEALTIGMYRKANGAMYRVYPAQADRTRLLAKRLVPAGSGYDWGFEYAGVATRFVFADERMTLEEAKAFGHQFGVCCLCGRLLTDPESVAAGIGPVCGKKI